MPELVAVMMAAAEKLDFDLYVVEGMRSKSRQAQLVKQGASQTQNSRHLTGHAIDVAPYVNGEIRWDWPLYTKMAPVIKSVARAQGVKITWGGDWRKFKDGPHWELDWKTYPVQKYNAIINDLVPDPEFPMPPPEEIADKERTIGQSKVVRSATIAGGATALTTGLEIAHNVDDAKDLVTSWNTILPIMASIVVLVAIAYIIYIRWDDFKKGFK